MSGAAPEILDPRRILAAEPEHPVWELPSVGQVQALLLKGEAGLVYLKQLLDQRRKRICLEEADPFAHGIIPPSWQLADRLIASRLECNILLILGGNRASKTEYAARKVIEILRQREKRVAWCFQSNVKNSIEMQQPRIWRYMPPEWKGVKRGEVAYVSYKQATGFSDGRFVAPNGSFCDFRHYSQDIKTIEGGEIDVAWCDELVPLEWVETLRYRLVTRDGLLIITFTPIEGYTPMVSSMLTGAETIEAREDAPLLAFESDPAKRIVPLVQQCKYPRTAKIVYFHSDQNPFANYSRLARDLAGATRDEILVRAYGVPTKAIAGRFPRFSSGIHVIDDERFQAITKGTWYHVCDPCNGRNFAMIWGLVLPDGTKVIAREWPQENDYIPGIGNPGPWAVPDGSKHDGKAGPAQSPFGFGLKRYQEEIRRVEMELSKEWGGRRRMQAGEANLLGWQIIEPEERWMDSRFGNTPTLAKETSTTLIEQFEELDPPVYFSPAAGVGMDEGITLINDALDYDTREPISALNQPKLYVHKRCTNTIYALQTWTGSDGKHGACKDFVDVLRYFLLAEPEYVDPDAPRGVAGGPGGWDKGTFADHEED
jgi:hypothetical protein